MSNFLRIKSVISFTLLILSNTAFSVCQDPTEDIFSSLLFDEVEDLTTINCSEKSKSCDDCLKTESPKDYILEKDIVKKKLIERTLENYQGILFDFISYEDQIENKKSVFSNNQCKISNIDTPEVFCADTQEKIEETRKFMTRIKQSLKKSKSYEAEEEKLSVLKLSQDKSSCLNTFGVIDGKSLLESPYSHVLYGYYNIKREEDVLNRQNDESSKNSDIEKYYESFPSLKYFNSSSSQQEIHKMISENKFDQDDIIKLLSKNGDLNENIKNKCINIKKNLELACSNKGLRDSNPFGRNYSNDDVELSSINYSLCVQNKAKSKQDIQELFTKIENPNNSEELKEQKYELNKLEKKFDKQMRDAANMICDAAVSGDKEVLKELEQDLITVYERAYYTPQAEEAANIFIEPAKVDDVVLAEKSEVSPPRKPKIDSTGKMIQSLETTSKVATSPIQETIQPERSTSIVTPNAANNVISSTESKSGPVETLQQVRKKASDAIQSLRELQKRDIEQVRNELAEARSTLSGPDTMNLDGFPIEQENNPTAAISSVSRDVENSTKDLNAILEAQKASQTRELVNKNLGAKRSIATVENNIAGQPVIAFNQDYFPVQNGKELDSVNIDLVFEAHKDDIFKILKSTKGSIIFIEDPYDPEQKLKVNLLKDLKYNIEDIERNPRLSLIKKKNLIRMKTYVYVLGRETMKFKNELKKKIDYSRFEVTQKQYEKVLENFKDISYSQLMEVIRKNH